MQTLKIELQDLECQSNSCTDRLTFSDDCALMARNVVKSFYTASILFDVLKQFGEVSPEVCLALV